MVLDCLGHPMFLLLEFPLLLHRHSFLHQCLLLLEEPALLAVGVALALLGSALTVGGLVTLSLTATRSSGVWLLVLHLQRLSPPASLSRI